MTKELLYVKVIMKRSICSLRVKVSLSRMFRAKPIWADELRKYHATLFSGQSGFCRYVKATFLLNANIKHTF